MNYLLLYWCIGCLFVGLGLGANMGECPSDEYPASPQYLIAAAVWPMYITAAIVLPRGVKLSRACAVKSSAVQP